MKTKDKKETKSRQAKKSVTLKNDKISKEEFPGYLHYEPGDDITKREKRVDVSLDDETFDEINNKIIASQTKVNDDNLIEDVEGEFKAKSEFDVTGEDLEALGPKDLSLDMGDDEDLKHRTMPVDFAGKDLDIPGTELDDAQEEIGSEDEENNHYSQ